MSRRKCPLNENSFGGRLRIYRESDGFKLVEFAKKLEISHGSLSDIENNNCNMSSKPLGKLILNTDINIYWLYTGQGEMNRNIEPTFQNLKKKGGDDKNMGVDNFDKDNFLEKLNETFQDFMKQVDFKLDNVNKSMRLFVYEKLDENNKQMHKLKKMIRSHGAVEQSKIGRGQPSEEVFKEVDVSSI